MKIIGLLLWFCCQSALALPAHNQLIQKIESIKTISADFEQVVFINGRRSASSKGHFILSRPGLMRWTTEKPMAQVLLADGQNIWVYEPKLEQVTKRSQKHGVKGTAGLFLSAKPNLWVQAYQVSYLENQPQHQVFQLKAKSKQRSISKLIVSFDHDALSKIEFWDQLGQYSQINLAHTKLNHSIAKSIFKLQLPKNVDVINLG